MRLRRRGRRARGDDDRWCRLRTGVPGLGACDGYIRAAGGDELVLGNAVEGYENGGEEGSGGKGVNQGWGGYR